MELLEKRVVCPQNGTAVLKGIRAFAKKTIMVGLRTKGYSPNQNIIEFETGCENPKRSFCSGTLTKILGMLNTAYSNK